MMMMMDSMSKETNTCVHGCISPLVSQQSNSPEDKITTKGIHRICLVLADIDLRNFEEEKPRLMLPKVLWVSERWREDLEKATDQTAWE